MLSVIKFGGSLYRSPYLDNWLRQLQQTAEKQCIVIVPGGGPFADAVRGAQKDYDFKDHYAHQMAILAMRQFGLLLLARAPAAGCLTAPDDVLPATGLFIWLPDELAMLKTDLPQSWQVTADSMALWLAQQLQADAMYLIKHTVQTTSQIQALSDDDVIDNYFAPLHQQQPLPSYIIAANQFRDFPAKAWQLQ